MKSFFRQNLGLKIASLALATFVWFLVSGNEERQFRIGNVPVIYNLGTNAPMVLVGSPPREVQVELSGPAPAVATAFADMTLRVDLADASTGRRTVLLSQENLQNLPRGCTAQITPNRLMLELDERVERQVPFLQASTGSPAEGYEVVSIDVRPPAVWVSGPASAFEDDEVRVMSDAIDLSGIDADGTVETHILRVGAAPNHEAVRLVNPGEFRAVVEVREKRDRVTAEVPVAGNPDAVDVQPDRRQVIVVLEGFPSLIAKMLEGLEAQVDSADLGTDWSRRPIALSRAPADYGAELISLRPDSVRVRALPVEPPRE